MKRALAIGVALLVLCGVAMGADIATPKQRAEIQAAINNPPPYPDSNLETANFKETGRICGLMSPLGKPTSITATRLTHNEMALCLRAAIDMDVSRASLPADEQEITQIAQLAAAQDQIQKLRTYIAMQPTQPAYVVPPPPAPQVPYPARMHCEPDGYGDHGMDCTQQ